MQLQHSVKSVALTYDFFRAQPEQKGFVNFQTRNLAWLENIIGSKSVWDSWNIKKRTVTVPTEPEKFKRALGNDTLFSQYLDDADNAWAMLYDNENISTFATVFDELYQHDLIIGFELPPSIKRALHNAGKIYISFYIHPIRFIRDLCFHVATNSQEIANALAESEIPQSEIEFQVRRFKALFSHRRLPAFSIPDDTPVLVGQTEKDSVLIREARFADWDDYEEHLSELLTPYSEVVFLEHPYRQNNSLVTEYLRGRHGKTVVSMRANSYGIIFSDTQIPFFLTLSSSLGVEALCSGQRCTFLLKDPREKFILDGIDIPNKCLVSHSVLEDAFWKRVFFGLGQKRRVRRPSSGGDFFLGDHYIRNSLDAWSFRALQSGLSIEPVRKFIIPSSSLDADRLNNLRNILVDSQPDTPQQNTNLSHIRKPWGQVITIPKPFVVGETSYIDLTQSTASYYLTQGFHGPENWGLWNGSKYSKMILPIDLSGKQEVELAISMVFRIFDGIMQNAPVIKILTDDREIGYILFRTSLGNKQEINFSTITDKVICQIEFYISHVESPFVLGLSNDKRELGFGIEKVSISIASVKRIGKKRRMSKYPQVFWGISGSTVPVEV